MKKFRGIVGIELGEPLVVQLDQEGRLAYSPAIAELIAAARAILDEFGREVPFVVPLATALERVDDEARRISVPPDEA